MNGWRQYLAGFLLPLSLCGLMLMIASTSMQMAEGLRWRALAIGILLSAPGIVLMLLTLPRGEDGNPEDDESELGDEPQTRVDVLRGESADGPAASR